MKKRILIAGLISLPILLSAQAPPAVIIVEEEDISFEEAAEAMMLENEETQGDEPQKDEDHDLENEFQDDTDEPEMATDIKPLPEVPDEIIEEEYTPEEPVFIKTEIPRPIELAIGESSDITLKSPWSPKPKQAAPSGWRYVPAPVSEAYPMEIPLKNGKKINLSVTPHQLVPEDSPLIVQAVEPGYDPDQGYQQTDSVSARLKSATDTLSEASSSLDSSIEQLNLLVNSLPKK